MKGFGKLSKDQNPRMERTIQGYLPATAKPGKRTAAARSDQQASKIVPDGGFLELTHRKEAKRLKRKAMTMQQGAQLS